MVIPNGVLEVFLVPENEEETRFIYTLALKVGCAFKSTCGKKLAIPVKGVFTRRERHLRFHWRDNSFFAFNCGQHLYRPAKAVV